MKLNDYIGEHVLNAIEDIQAEFDYKTFVEYDTRQAIVSSNNIDKILTIKYDSLGIIQSIENHEGEQ